MAVLTVSACEAVDMSVKVVLTVPLLMRPFAVRSEGCLKDGSLLIDDVETRDESLRRR